MTCTATPTQCQCAQQGELVIKTIAMPRDTNPDGDIFGGWLLSQMDLGGALAAHQLCKGRVTTVAVEAMRFHHPVQVGDNICCYANLIKIGTTSMRFRVTAWVEDRASCATTKVTEAEFCYVALDANRRPRPVLNQPSEKETEMPEEKFRKSLENLDNEIQQIRQNDDPTPAEVEKLNEQVKASLSKPPASEDTEGLLSDFNDAATSFEASHPTLTSLINEVSQALSNLGI